MNSKSIQMLVDEHEVILSAIGLAKQTAKIIGKDDTAYEKTVRGLIDFFRNYADKYHHHKEEEVLFPLMNEKNELLGDGLVKEMFDNHEDFRDMIRKILDALDKKDFASSNALLQQYTEALLDHIAVENEEVFQVAESLLDERELENVFFKFEDIDRDLGREDKNALVQQMEHIGKIMEA